MRVDRNRPNFESRYSNEIAGHNENWQESLEKEERHWAAH